MAVTALSGQRWQGLGENTIMNTLTYSGSTNFIHIGDSYKTRGEKINASDSALVGYKVASVTVRIKDYDGNGLTGNLTCSILDSAGDAVSGDSFPAYDTAGLTSTETDITFTNTNQTRVLQDDDSIALQYTGDATHRVGFERSDGADAFDGTKTCRAYRVGTTGVLGVETGEDQIMKINSSDEDKATVTDVPAGSEFEQTDDYKSYQRSGLPVSLDDLKAYYNLDETSGDCINSASAIGSTDAISSFDLTVTGATQGVTGKIDKAISFTGNNVAQADDSNLTDTNFLSQTGAVWTICFWVKLDSLVGDLAFVCTSAFQSGENGCLIRTSDSSGHLNFMCGTGGDDRIEATSSTVAIPDTNWNFVMYQYDNSTGNVKVSVNNGSVETLSKASGSTLSNTDTPSDKLVIGNEPALTNDLNGDLDEVSIWNRILTTAELTKIYNAGSGKLLGKSWVERGTAI